MSDVQELGAIALPVSLFLIVFSLGLRTSFSAATYLLREPRLLARSLVAMYVVMPIVVAVLVMSFALHPAVKVALVALAVSPVPPLLPRKELKLIGPSREVFVYGLLVATSLLAIVVAPVGVALFASLFGIEGSVAPAAIARIVVLSVLLPLGVGLALRQWWPAAGRLASPAGTAGMILLLAAVVLMLPRLWPGMRVLFGDGTLLAIVIVALVALAVGHLLGGPIDDDRTVLALATASRHPAVAIALAAVVEQALAPAAILLAFVVSAIATIPYTVWRKRRRASAPAERAGSRSS